MTSVLFNRNRFSFCLLACLTVFTGCQRGPLAGVQPPGEGHVHLRRLLAEDKLEHVVTRAFERSLWIYVPQKENIFAFKADPKNPAAKSPETAVKPAIRYLDGQFSDHQFILSYDIEPAKGYANSPGYQSAYSETFQESQHKILNALYQAYGAYEEVPGEDRLVRRVDGDVDFLGAKKNATHKEMVHSYVQTEAAPDFFVIIFADIQNGLEIELLFYLKDLKRAYTDMSFQEEYARRMVSAPPVGNTAIVGDTTGQHVDFHDITWPEFLARQMVYRINFKYQQSAFPPSDDARRELLTIAADTLNAYSFKDFTAVVLNDLNTQNSVSVSPADLTAYQSEAPAAGTLHHIQFQIGPPSGDNEI